MQLSDHYHYIIAGAGLAGSSLLARMMHEPFFQHKKILVIDQAEKNQNDRTWCFWEKENGLFESIVHHRWKELDFFSDRFSATLAIDPYQYKMIRSIDLYKEVKEKSSVYKNIEWKYETIEAVGNHAANGYVKANGHTYKADYIFSSIPFATPGQTSASGYYHLLQHFKGWLIQTDQPFFDPAKACFMDFRVRQDAGTSFMYVLPTSANTALVEYTLFTENLLEGEKYNDALKSYINTQLQIKAYQILHEEFGIIPMTNQPFPQQLGRIIYTGIAGGQAKGSSGYTFQFVQKRADQIIALLVAGKPLSLKQCFNDHRFRLYDSVLLNVLSKRKMAGAEIFARIFQNNSPQTVLRFLDNESSVWEDLQIMRSVPTGIFLPAAIREMMG